MNFFILKEILQIIHNFFTAILLEAIDFLQKKGTLEVSGLKF